MSTPLSPAVSVVIPLYNKVDLVAKAIESVLNQDFEDFEIIIVDDGSTDGSTQVAQGYAERLGGLCTYVRQERAGAGAARNRGMRIASGEFIALLDADDLWAPEKLSRQIGFMEAHQDIDWSATNYFIVDGAQTEPVAALPHEGGGSSDPWRIVDWFSAMADEEIFIQTSGVVLRRSLVERVGEFDESIPSGQDFDYWVRAGEAAPRCGYCTMPCYTYIKNSTYSISFNEPSRYTGKIDMLTRLMKRSTQPDRPQAYQDLIRTLSEDVTRRLIAEGHLDVARSLLRSFPEHWRALRHAGYLILTYVPVPIVRFMTLARLRVFDWFRHRSQSV
ncbi:MAG TPA: glycosyltransferase family A protein [Rhodothermia bacterium]